MGDTSEELEGYFEKLFSLLEPIIEEIEQSKNIRIVSHYDADGISSASIMFYALNKLGKNVHLSIVNQIKDRVIERLNNEEHDLLMFTDLGSGYLDELNDLKTKKLAIVDHHHIKGEYDGDFSHANPHLIGIDGDEISGSGLSYLLARSLDENNKNLAYIAVIGAIGDIQEEKWVMKGLNKYILDEAIDSGMIKKKKGIRLFGRVNRPVYKALQYSTDPYIPGISGNQSACIQFLSDLDIDVKNAAGKWKSLKDLEESEKKKLASAIIKERVRSGHEDAEKIFGDIYTFEKFPEEFSDVREFSTSLNACGRMGQPSIGVLACLGNQEIQEKMRGVQRGYRSLLGKYIKWVKSDSGNVRSEDNAYYVVAKDNIHENFVGTVISIVQNSFFEDKPIVGFAYTEDGEVKISGRVPDRYEKDLNLKEIFEKATDKVGGRSGGHKKAAGAFIPKDKIEDFINVCEEEFQSGE
ncbi:MAG: DHHA1 domain-containing protein [Candidatus Aenigmatarchaeota archaeon]